MSSALGVILAWGIDLGGEASDQAELFSDYFREQLDEQETSGYTPTWEVITYGVDDSNWALVLARSSKEIELADNDNSIGDWLDVRMSTSGLEMASQPDQKELVQLGQLIDAIDGASDRDDLLMTALALPFYGN